MTFYELAELPAHEIMEYVQEVDDRCVSIDDHFGDGAAGNHIIIRLLERAAEGTL